MKLSYKYWNRPISYEDNYYHIISIENKKFFRKILEDLNEQYQENQGLYKLSVDHKEVNFTKNVYTLLDFFNIKLNSNKIKNLIIDELINSIHRSEQQDQILNLITELNAIIQDLSVELEYETDRTELTIYDIIKASKALYLQEKDMIKNLLNVLKFLSHKLSYKLIILVNFMSFVTKEEFEETIYYLELEKIYVLFIETDVKGIDYYDHCYIIDDDLCEI